MPDSQIHVSLADLRQHIHSFLEPRLDNDSISWLSNSANNLWQGGQDWEFFTTFSKVPRYTGKDNLELTPSEKQKAESIRHGWKPATWTFDQLGRTYILLSIANRDKEEFLDLLLKTYQSSDMGEAEALYKSLPVLPYPSNLQKWAAEGIRTNMTSVFNAVAHYNPYPAEFLNDDAWNQMVLKALFVETPLYPIQRLDNRANKKLADMLLDYAHERWAADREVSPELWRPVGPFAEGQAIEDLRKELQHPELLHRQAAALALADSPSDEARELLQDHQDFLQNLKQDKVDWDLIGKTYNKEDN